MPRACTVCTHEHHKAIDSALVAGVPTPELTAKYRVSEDALLRHKAAHLPAKLMKSQEAKELANADDLLSELRQCIERVSLLSDACDRWLRDPDDPTQYNVGPRSEDVTVTYEEMDSERVLRKKAPLSELLARLEGRYTVTAVETKHADPRELLLKSYDRLQRRLELVAKLIGELDERPQLNVTISPQWVEIRTVLIQALEPYPEARQHVARALLEIDGTKADG
jgi:hypothetical protein